ncbi:hypothetical protein H6G54_24935 [Anabaena cylindrica FACHB-243]|uniref:Excinuclease ATPase subunit n=1 Tax=Anabaena cylindrica (strain ATCC 27899 / PCC 7122) TaxID=272123 RepID=K9ZDE1_ANACC|nr:MULTISPECIES: hypothetical protein [Anabaena]AFZ57218.1 hypothetical protein Anacy_1721 [Anabaena cylindrica PCC 7122]MBD2420889.1 hypothetical protein [Anabaena cylindrica FACHB-243]MCM2405638.1 hypothetical protein [Anabaena sp. CCAP 1446/1C]BAY05810.1 hypothetical protein NIES19_50870 [Anabaena cylindrica PCC 7122]
MPSEPNKSLEIQDIIGLKAQHFADLIRTAQLVFDPAAGLSGRNVEIDWENFGIPVDVADNLKELGQEYQYSSPHLPPEVVWSKLTTETRIWFIENKNSLWRFEELFPALDED